MMHGILERAYRELRRESTASGSFHLAEGESLLEHAAIDGLIGFYSH